VKGVATLGVSENGLGKDCQLYVPSVNLLTGILRERRNWARSEHFPNEVYDIFITLNSSNLTCKLKMFQ